MKQRVWFSLFGILNLAVVLGLLSGCTVYMQPSQPAPVYTPPPVVQPAPIYVAPPPQEYVAPQPPPPVFAVTPAVLPEAVVEIHVESDFYEPLQPYGNWVVIPGFGRCWVPAGVDSSWRPYTEGHWQRTDAGWYWVSDERWGWATYHYGRWHYDNSFGWVWIPQTQWAPAWVAWRDGGGYTGWAPLPPEARIGDNGTFQSDNVDPHTFVFVEQKRMLEPQHHQNVIVNNTTIINNTINITKVVVLNKIVINEGPRPESVAQVTGRQIDVLSASNLRTHQEAPAVAASRSHVPVSTRTMSTNPPPPATYHPATYPTQLPVVRQSPVSTPTLTRPPAVQPSPHQPSGPQTQTGHQVAKPVQAGLTPQQKLELKKEKPHSGSVTNSPPTPH